MRTWIFAVAVFLVIVQAAAAEPVPLVVQDYGERIRERDWRKINLFDHIPRRYLEIGEDVELSCADDKGRPMTRNIRIDAGVYRVDETLHHTKTGRDWLLVHVTPSESVQHGYNNSRGRTWDYQHSVAFDPESLALFPRELVRYTQSGRHLDGSPWTEGKWTFDCTPAGVSTGTQPVVRLVTEEEFGAHQVAIQEAQAATLAHEEEERELQRQRERPLKLEVGASLCKLSGVTILQGFNEGRSPDNDKVKIRIWRSSTAVDGRPGPVVRPADFRESTIWDSVDGWDLCPE